MPPDNPYESPRCLAPSNLSAPQFSVSELNHEEYKRLLVANTRSLWSCVILIGSAIAYPLFPVGWLVSCWLSYMGLSVWNYPLNDAWLKSFRWTSIFTRLVSVVLLGLAFVAFLWARSQVWHFVRSDDIAKLFDPAISLLLISLAGLVVSLVAEFAFWCHVIVALQLSIVKPLKWTAIVIGGIFILSCLLYLAFAQDFTDFYYTLAIIIVLTCVLVMLISAPGSLGMILMARSELHRRLLENISSQPNFNLVRNALARDDEHLDSRLNP